MPTSSHRRTNFTMGTAPPVTGSLPTRRRGRRRRPGRRSGRGRRPAARRRRGGDGGAAGPGAGRCSGRGRRCSRAIAAVVSALSPTAYRGSDASLLQVGAPVVRNRSAASKSQVCTVLSTAAIWVGSRRPEGAELVGLVRIGGRRVERHPPPTRSPNVAAANSTHRNPIPTASWPANPPRSANHPGIAVCSKHAHTRSPTSRAAVSTLR